MSSYGRSYQRGESGDLFRGRVEYRVEKPNVRVKVSGKWNRSESRMEGRVFYEPGEHFSNVYGPYATAAPAKRAVSGYKVGRQDRGWGDPEPTTTIVWVGVERLAAQAWTDLDDDTEYVFVPKDELDRLRRVDDEHERDFIRNSGLEDLDG